MIMTFKVKLFLLNLEAIILVVSMQVECVLPPYLPNAMNGNLGRSNLIKRYCELGLNYKEVLLFLLMHHGIRLSLRQSKRLVKNIGIKRWRDASDLRNDIFAIIELKLSESDNKAGYRQMTQSAQVDHQLVVG